MLVLRQIGIDALLAGIIVLLTIVSCQYVKGSKELYLEHARLLDKLFLDYDKVSRPGSQYPVNVTLGIAVAQLVKVDEKMEGMNLNVWYRMAWNDNRLKWNPREYGNITNFKVDSDYLWTPDIMLYKPLTSEAGQVLGVKKNDDDLAWKISVYSDGTAAFNFPGSIFGQCPLTISDYPYDEHKCSFVFASWVHDGSELIVQLRPGNPLDFANYVYNNEWHIVGKEPKAIQEKYACCPAPFYLATFDIHVRRGASSYVSNYIVPSILIAILSIMMFTLPPEVGKRMEIGINLLLCLSVYLTILNTKMPTRSDAFPLLSKFYGCCIFILTCALLCTCWVVAYYFHDMSGWEIYAMSKFVEVGVLKYLRRALRFPNATKVYPSDILVSVNTQRTIEVKPMPKEKTNFASDAPAKKHENNPTKEDTENVKKGNDTEKLIEMKTMESTKQDEDSSPSDKKKEKTLTNLKNRDDSEKQNVEEYRSGDSTEKKTLSSDQEKTNKKEKQEFTNEEGNADNKETQKVKKKSKENIDNAKLNDDPADENDSKDSTKKGKKERRKHKKRDKSETAEEPAVEKKSKPSKEKDKLGDTNRESETSEKIRNSRSASRESNTSQISKKSNNVYGERITAGLAEKPKRGKRRTKSNKEELGVENLGADNDEEKNKEIGRKNEKEGNERKQKRCDVREAPSLNDKTEETGAKGKSSEKVSTLATKPSLLSKNFALPQVDQEFDKKQETKKKHDSIKLLKQLSEYFSDHLERKKNRYQWRQAAIVLNRLFLIILCISIAMSIIVVFLAR